jgi:outer membrane protein assembly factor BamB
MKRNRFALSLILFMGISLVINYSCKQENNWTHFRGTGLNGVADAVNAPVRWKADSNIVWKSEIHGRGWSSPVVLANQVWMTTATEDGHELFAVCLDYKTGKTIFDIKVFAPDTVYNKHAINSYATPTPCIEEGYVYVHFGTYGTACLRTSDGSIVWKFTGLTCDHVQGPASSPMIYKDLLILHLEGSDKQYIAALDKSSGEIIWQVERPQELMEPLEWIGKKAYITPIVIKLEDRDLLISNGSAVCIAYDPATGEEVWRIVKGEDSTIASPFSENGKVYFYTSFVTSPEGEQYAELLAADPRGTGDITATNILWSIHVPILQLLTPVIRDGLIYTVDAQSNLMCIEAATGSTVWSDRLPGKYHSSPVCAAGNVYFSATNGTTTVIRQGRKLEIIAVNELEGEIWATPAIIRDNLLIRTSKYLYRIGS